MALCSVENCKSWDKSGKQDFIRQCRNLIGKTPHMIRDVASKDIKRALYELCWCGLHGNLKLQQVTAALSEILDLHQELPSLLGDVLGILDVEVVCVDDADVRDRFMNFVPLCTGLVSDELLKERLDQETLENIGIFQSRLAFQQKYVKTKTKLYYKQQKFNLVREESEGYSKLITELNQDLRCISPQQILQHIMGLVGCFNLDPNRVLDVILESFERRPEEETFFVKLIQIYMCDHDTLCNTLGFKFHFYQETADLLTPASLYKLAALLLKHQLISLDALYPHLMPADTQMVEAYKKDVQDAKQYAKKLSIVILGEKDKDKEADDKDIKGDQIKSNQKLGLCEWLVRVGAWEHANRIIERMPPFFASAHPPIAQAICTIVHHMIQPLYLTHSGLPKSILKRHAAPQVDNLAQLCQVSTFEGFKSSVVPIVRCLGPHLSCDVRLIIKLNRLARAFIAKRPQLGGATEELEDVFRGFMTLYDEVLLPSLTLLPNNCALAEELWTFLKHLTYEHRYRLYGQWKNDSHQAHARLITARADSIDRAKYIMKRLAKENVKPLGRQIGKLSHSSPGHVFDHILSQIQRYDNFIGPVVDSLKFLTSLSYDVLAYCIIEALANPEKERLKHDDTNISLWLQSLANFCGAVLKKYQIELAGLLQYVANQMKANKSYDLLILREVVTKMAGIEVSEEVTSDQLQAMNGGELLRQEGGYFSQVRNTKKSTSRLKEALLEQNLAIPMCLLMAQQRVATVFPPAPPPTDTNPYTQHDADKRHIKLIGKLYDQCQDTLVQFLGFLALQLSGDEIRSSLPTIESLLTEYYLSPDVVFALWRPIFNNAINAKYDELRKVDKKDKQASGSQNTKLQRYVEASDHVLKPVAPLVQCIGPPKVWDEIGLQFYVTFWTLTMYDLQVPEAAYERQLSQLSTQLAAIEDNKDLTASKKKKEKERCSSMMDKIKDEEKRQQEHVKMVMNRLKIEKDQWFQSKSAKHATITSLLQHCLFPRCCFTASDAMYCARFLYTMHSLKTPNFSSLICYDRIFADITWALSSCTESEAHRYGRFLCAVLDDLMRWHGEKSIFEKECNNFPGFLTVFRKVKNVDNRVADHLDYENFRHVCHKWHYSITRVAVACLESSDFIRIRNALIILIKILPHYPRVIKLGQALERRVDRVCQDEKEKRPDIYALALGYSGQLKGKRKTWISDQDFHKKTAEPASKSAGSAKAAGSTQQTSSTEKHNTESTNRPASSKDASDVSASGKDASETGTRANETIERKSRDKEVTKEGVKTSSQNNVKVESTTTEKRSKNSEKEEKTKTKKDEGRELKMKRSKDKDGKIVHDEKRSSSKLKETDDKVRAHSEKEGPKEKRQSSKDKEKHEKGAKEERVKERKKDEGREDKLTKEIKRDDWDCKEVKRERADEWEVKDIKRDRVDEWEKEKYRDAERREGRGHRVEWGEAEKEVREKERRKEREAMRDREGPMREWDRGKVMMDDDGLSVDRGSGASSHRHSAEPSPRHAEDRDVKRRKVDLNSSAKSPRSGDYDRGASLDREDRHEKKDRKRTSGAADRSMEDRDLVDIKRHKGDRESGRSKLNGSSADGKTSSKDHKDPYVSRKSRSVDREKNRREGGEAALRQDLSPGSTSSGGKKSSRKAIQSPDKERAAVKKDSKKSKHR